MKLRIHGNSLRLRLTQTEVADFVHGGRIENSISLGHEPSQRLAYALVADPSAKSLSVRYESGVISVIAPSSKAEEWAQSDEVGLYGEQLWPNGETVRLLVEKDFQCLDKRLGEQIPDAYPHPSQQRKRGRPVAD